jgi:hypothetical protein
VCSHSHRCHQAVAAQHSFLGETMTSTNKKMFNTPTKKNNGKLLSNVRKKTDYVRSRNITGVQVVSVHYIDCIRLIINGFFVIVISVVAVCRVEDVVVIVNDIDNKEKTRLKRQQQLCE